MGTTGGEGGITSKGKLGGVVTDGGRVTFACEGKVAGRVVTDREDDGGRVMFNGVTCDGGVGVTVNGGRRVM